MQLDDLYRRVIMDHYKNPRNQGQIDADTLTIDLNNPTCGDRISLQMHIADHVVKSAKFKGEGCSISIASASMMTEAVRGKSVDEAIALAEKFSRLMKGEEVSFEELEDIEALSGVNKFPARIKCATLAWNALRKGAELNQRETNHNQS
jgi:nitrogen fixation NifU-like protein